MPVRIVEWQLPYTWGTGIEIDSNKVISLLLREENNLIMVNNDNEVYTDLQLQSGLTPNSDFPVWVTVWKVLQADWWTKSGLILNWKTTSGDYARWIYATDWELYFDSWTGTWKQVYYSTEVDALIQALDAKVENYYSILDQKIDNLADSLAEVAYTWEYLDTINRPDICVIEISAISSWIGTGIILSWNLIDWSVVDLSLAQGVTWAINEVDVDNKQISLLPNRTAVDWMIWLYKEDSSNNYTIYLFDGDQWQAQVNADWDATSGVAEILNKPAVIDNTTSTSTTDVLSANMWKELQDQINNLKARGRFLSNWNSTTWLPTTNPTTLPYTYNSWDYFVVTTVGATNYRPTGTTYTWAASTTVETETVNVGDMYIFDSTEWLLQINTARTIVVDQALDSTSTNPVENRVITNALAGKQDTLVSGTNIKTVKWTSLLGSGNVAISEFSPSNSGSTGQVLKKTSTWYNWANETSQVSDIAYGSSWDWVTWTAPSKNAVYDKLNSMDTTIAGKQATLSAWTGISISNNTVSNTGVTSVNGNTGAVTVQEFTGASWGVKVFDLPSQWGSLSSSLDWQIAWWQVIYRENISNSEWLFYIQNWDLNNRQILAVCTAGDTLIQSDITYNSAGTVTSRVDSSTTVQEELVSWTNIKTVNGTSLLGSGNVSVWTLTSETVVSGDSGVTYTIKVSNSAPSGASNTTITLVP